MRFVYFGIFEGDATFQYADGSTWKGQVGLNVQHECSLINGNEYAGGVPNGQGVYEFCDGSKYSGVMYNNTMSGKGCYEDIQTGKSIIQKRKESDAFAYME